MNSPFGSSLDCCRELETCSTLFKRKCRFLNHRRFFKTIWILLFLLILIILFGFAFSITYQDDSIPKNVEKPTQFNKNNMSRMILNGEFTVYFNQIKWIEGSSDGHYVQERVISNE